MLRRGAIRVRLEGVTVNISDNVLIKIDYRNHSSSLFNDTDGRTCGALGVFSSKLNFLRSRNFFLANISLKNFVKAIEGMSIFDCGKSVEAQGCKQCKSALGSSTSSDSVYNRFKNLSPTSTSWDHSDVMCSNSEQFSLSLSQLNRKVP
eukprot:m.281483 g.281483  ORF g.281483 m.281483 type:complete len:149 (+) comp16332_c0_seq18:56-502(+)